MKKSRKTETTYFEMLDWYFKKQMSTPISPAAQAVMTHILNLCNMNYSENCQITMRQLAARINIDVRTLKTKMSELAENDYVNYEITGQECYNIAVKMSQDCSAVTKVDAEVCADGTNLQQSCKKSSVVTPFSAYKRKENKPIKSNIRGVKNLDFLGGNIDEYVAEARSRGSGVFPAPD